MPLVEFIEDFDWYFESGCCGFAVRAYEAGWCGEVAEDVAAAAAAAGKARIVDLEPGRATYGNGEI